ncbi:MAG: AI-2E family transporter [Anaerolineae bacterium]|nr:AI-2E family transporter [Anaerolineae bacterium]
MSNPSTSITSPPWSLATKRIVALIVAGLLLLIMRRIEGSVWTSLVIALVLAYLLSPLVGFFEQRLKRIESFELRRSLSVLLTWFVVIGLFALFVGLIVPAMVAQIRQFADDLPGLIEETQADLKAALSQEITIGKTKFVPWDELENAFAPDDGEGTTVTERLQSAILALADPALGLVGGVVSFLFTIFFVLVMLFYLMRDGPLFVNYLVGSVPESYQGDARLIFHELALIWNAYLRGQIMLCLAIAIATYSAALILGLPQPLLLATVAGFLEFIPNIGPTIAQIPALLFAFTTDSTTIASLDAGLVYAVVVSLTYIAIQQLEAIFLVPRILGGSLNLHPFVVLLAILIGASLGSVLGVILAAPVAATLRLFGRYLRAKLLDEDFATAPAFTAEKPGFVYRLIHFWLSKRFPSLPPDEYTLTPNDKRPAPTSTPPATPDPVRTAAPREDVRDVSGWSL